MMMTDCKTCGGRGIRRIGNDHDEAPCAACLGKGKVSTSTAEVRRCLTCGHPENDHPYRHPFQALTPDRPNLVTDLSAVPMPDGWRPVAQPDLGCNRCRQFWSSTASKTCPQCGQPATHERG